MFNDGRDGTGFTTGVVVGALVGAGVALLFAPKAGDELRSDLNGSMTSLREAVARRYRALAEMAGVESNTSKSGSIAWPSRSRAARATCWRRPGPPGDEAPAPAGASRDEGLGTGGGADFRDTRGGPAAAGRVAGCHGDRRRLRHAR
ncbi:MAG: YtxH domain-containing protein [Vicinamibacterales bacterium]